MLTSSTETFELAMNKSSPATTFTLLTDEINSKLNDPSVKSGVFRHVGVVSYTHTHTHSHTHTHTRYLILVLSDAVCPEPVPGIYQLLNQKLVKLSFHNKHEIAIVPF